MIYNEKEVGMSTATLERPVGLHQFTAYEGDLEYVEDDSGLLVPANPVVFESPTYKNLITTVGKQLILDRLFGLGTPPAALSSLGVGTDSTATAAAQTQLNPSVAGSVLIQALSPAASRASQTVTATTTFGTGVANFTWNEAGLFNGTVNGTSILFNRVLIGPFTKTTSVSVVYSASITQG